ncbi:MAG: hypothetical protein FJZ96_03105 [Chloroflexi bacterium]|nr:hypothetical protein [Chloroflexota bacterium]
MLRAVGHQEDLAVVAERQRLTVQSRLGTQAQSLAVRAADLDVDADRQFTRPRRGCGGRCGGGRRAGRREDVRGGSGGRDEGQGRGGRRQVGIGVGRA